MWIGVCTVPDVSKDWPFSVSTTGSPLVLMVLPGSGDGEEVEESLRPVSSPIRSGGGVAYILAAITNCK